MSPVRFPRSAPSGVRMISGVAAVSASPCSRGSAARPRAAAPAPARNFLRSNRRSNTLAPLQQPITPESPHPLPYNRSRTTPRSDQGVCMPIQTTANIWHNGKLIPWEKAQVHVMSHVLHYGSSVFEGIRCYKQPQGAAIFRLPEHMQRLLDSARIYRMDIPLHARRAQRRRRRTGRSQRHRALLHPAHLLPRLRRDRRQPQGLSGRDLHRELPVGQIRPRRCRRGCVHLLLESPRAQHHACAGQGRRATT